MCPPRVRAGHPFLVICAAASFFAASSRADGGRPDPVMRERAFESGAQWISTDLFSEKLPAASRIVFPGCEMIRTNPVLGGRNQPIAP